MSVSAVYYIIIQLGIYQVDTEIKAKAVSSI